MIIIMCSNSIPIWQWHVMINFVFRSMWSEEVSKLRGLGDSINGLRIFLCTFLVDQIVITLSMSPLVLQAKIYKGKVKVIRLFKVCQDKELHPKITHI